MKEKCKIIMVIAACLCPLAMQAQEVKTLKTEESKTDVETASLDTIPNVSLPQEEYAPSRPILGGFPILQGKSYHSEAQEPWMSEDGKWGWKNTTEIYPIFKK